MPFKRLRTLPLTAALLAGGASAVHAAAPDGAGPWADVVGAFEQGVQSTSKPVPADRSSAGDARGVAEGGVKFGTFVSLGIGGRIVLEFRNSACTGPGADLRLVETTREPYPAELADVYVSSDGSKLTQVAASVDKDRDIDVPDSVGAFRFVVLVDATDPELFDGADGYDLDGVRALHTEGCPPPPAPAGTPGGSAGTPGGTGGGSADPGGAQSGRTVAQNLLAAPKGRKRSTCRVPALRNRTVKGARRILRRRNCRVGKVRARSSRIRKGRVISTRPAGGTERPFRSRVRLIVSRGR